MPIIAIDELKKDRIIKTAIGGIDLEFHTTWGLFSPEKIDEGTLRLIPQVVLKAHDRVLDLGCGYGVIGIALARREPAAVVQMIDKDFVAVDYAEKNIALNQVKNARAYLSNGFDQVPAEDRFNVIVSNLPAKISKEYFWILFEEARQRLVPGGTFYVVTIAGLRRFTEKNFLKIFGNYRLVDSRGTYFVAAATKA